MRWAPLAILLCLGCTPSHVRVQATPQDALDKVATRLTERGIALDAGGRTAQRLKTGYFCYRAPGREGRSWERSFASTTGSPTPFSHEAPVTEQDHVVEKCPYVFQVEVAARPAKGGGTRLEVSSSWWRPVQSRCTPVGDPLMGQTLCEYRYVGTKAPADPAHHVYGLLKSL